ncbi:hypothetical protein MHU86_10894 [Fragilaria crotonensis]|nr:hypothetical protein MHU86_10894 [Fragilaria crotonensis]
MVEEQTESGFGTTVRAFAFDGDETKYRSWEGKTLALAGSKGFLLALTKESTGTALTVEEFEYGVVEVPGVAVTGGAVGAPTTRPTTMSENRKCDGDPFKAWAILQEKYCATDAEENYPELDQAFNDCKLDGTKKDPELWFNDMDHLNMRLARINLKYQKDDLQLKSHMMSAMSNDYESVIIKFRGDLQETSLAKLRKEIVLQYKTLVKTVGKSGSESVLNANVSKQPWRKFKGTCRNCGKIGHKANECRSSKVESTEVTTKGSGTPAGDKSHVTCYNCQQKGHFMNKCTLPKKLKSDATADMAMFVGASFLDDPVDVNPTVADTIADSFSTFRQFDNI